MLGRAVERLLQTLRNPEDEFSELYHQHGGAHRVLVRDGTNAWRYYLLTSRERRFWRRLSRTEREYLRRRGRRGCLVCAVRDAMAIQERLEAGLHRAMMSFLLVPLATEIRET